VSDKKKLVLRNSKGDAITYVIKKDNEVIWQGTDIHQQFQVLQAENKNADLVIGWKNTKGSLIV